MYQDKIKNEALNAIQSSKPDINYSIFEKADFEPLTFEPEEDDFDATAIARDILVKRNNIEIIEMSKSIKYMLSLGEKLLQSLALSQLRTGHRKSVSLSDGRALYLLHHYFDLSTLNIKNLNWCEVFATLVLMQTAEIKYLFIREYGDDELSKALKTHVQHSTSLFREEIIDSVARVEVLSDIKAKDKTTGSFGGKAKAAKCLPLKGKVITLYLEKYTGYDNKRAGAIIEAELSDENNELLLLSKSIDKSTQFATWVGQFKNKKLKLPITK